MSLRFVDTFWESDFNGTLGFDLLCKRVREGQKTCKDVEDFFRKKSKIQQQYSKSLKSLVRSADGKEEIGELGRSWVELKDQTEATARLYETSANDYNRLADDLARFNDSSKLLTKQVEDRVKERQKIKKSQHNRAIDFKGTYVEKCREMMLAENQHDVASRAVTSLPKDVEKLKIKFEKCRDAMEKADNQYKQSMETLEQARSVWESEMEEACKVYQQNEVDRIDTLRDHLWKSTNIDSRLCVEWDQGSETVRQSLEKCDIGRDLDGFINKNMTGHNRPASIVYESYFEDRQSKKPEKSARNQPLPPLPPLPHNNDTSGEYSYTEIGSVPKWR